MSIESSADWDGLRAVSAVVSQTLRKLEAAVDPDVTTADLDRMAAAFLASCGARSAPAGEYGFPGSVLISINDEVVHGIPGPRRIMAGDLVSLDVTVELDGYVADAARSLVVGNGPAAAHRLVHAAQAAFSAGLRAARPGNRARDIGRAVGNEVRRQGFTVVKGLAGHGVGRAIHEPPTIPNDWDPRCSARLNEGLVITIEPMITIGAGEAVEAQDGWTIQTQDRTLAAHHEDTIVITGGQPIVLTHAA